METHAHQQLKQLAMAFLREHGCRALAAEVRCPISRFRVDVAGYLDTFVQPASNGASGGAVPRRRQRCEPRSVIIECKQSREDFLRDSERLNPLLALREELNRIRRSIEEHRIKALEPELRQSGSSLFPELEEWEFAASRLPAYRKILRKLQRVDAKLHGETKFFWIARYRLADYLYLAAPRGMIRPRELPPGWGLLECEPRTLERRERTLFDQPARLEVVVEAPPHTAKAAHRQRLLRNIAVAASTALARMHAAQER